MLKNAIKLFQTGNKIKITSKANIQTSTTLNEKWDLLTAVILERKPVITPALNDIEKEFTEYLGAVEFERSLKSETELNLEKEKKLLESRKDIDDVDLVVKQSTQDLIDSFKEEFANFKPADRITSADKSNDVKSLQRKLDKHLVLVLNQKIGDQKHFLLPQGQRQDGETLRQCADRVIKEKCGTEIKAQIFGNAPCGFYKYKYPKELRNGKDSVGAKIFIYFARYSSGQVAEKNAEYKWLDKSELNTVLPSPYKNSVVPILFDD